MELVANSPLFNSLYNNKNLKKVDHLKSIGFEKEASIAHYLSVVFFILLKQVNAQFS